MFVFPIYSTIVIVERGARDADPEITAKLVLLPALVFVLVVSLALMTYVLISSIRGLTRLQAEHD